MIDADGVKYLACGGAIWMENQGNAKDPITFTYDVVFEDANRKTHELKLVHSLAITDLPRDTPACQNGGQHSIHSVDH
jgi:hypothetical protein